jgi:hypothetical protein
MENTLLNQDLQEEVKESFKIENLEGATWAFRKLRAISNKKAEIEAVAAEEIARVELWKKKEVEKYESDTEYFESLISSYFVEERAKNKKFKLSTPYGKVSTRKASKWIYEDEEALKQYVKENDIDAIRIKEELDKTSLKKICKDAVNQDTGEILPGVRVEETETITVKAE